MTETQIGGGGLFEDRVQLRLGEEPRPSPQQCASLIWGADAEYQAAVEPPGATTDWRTLYLLNNRTGEVVDIAPLSTDATSRLYKVSGRNLDSVRALAQFIADRTRGVVN